MSESVSNTSQLLFTIHFLLLYVKVKEITQKPYESIEKIIVE